MKMGEKLDKLSNKLYEIEKQNRNLKKRNKKNVSNSVTAVTQLSEKISIPVTNSNSYVTNLSENNSVTTNLVKSVSDAVTNSYVTNLSENNSVTTNLVEGVSDTVTNSYVTNLSENNSVTTTLVEGVSDTVTNSNPVTTNLVEGVSDAVTNSYVTNLSENNISRNDGLVGIHTIASDYNNLNVDLIKVDNNFTTDIIVHNTRKLVRVLLDTGSPASFLPFEILESVLPSYSKQCKINRKLTRQYVGASGSKLHVLFKIKLRVKFPNIVNAFKVEFNVASGMTVAILGRDFLYDYKMSIIYTSLGYQLQSPMFTKHIIHNVNTEITPPGKHYKQQLLVKEKGTYLITAKTKIPYLICPDQIQQPKGGKLNVWLLNTAKQDILVKEGDICVSIQRISNPNRDITHVIKPNDIITNNMHTQSDVPLYLSNLYLHPKYSKIYNKVKNVDITESCSICVNHFKQFPLNEIDNIEQFHKTHTESRQVYDIHEDFEIFNNEFGEDIEKLIDRVPALEVNPPTSKNEVQEVIDKKIKQFPHEYHKPLTDCLLRNNIVIRSTYDIPTIREKMSISVNRDKFVKNTRVYPCPYKYKNFLVATLQTLLKHGIIEPADPGQQFGAPAFLNLRKNNSFRLLIDLRALNQSLSDDSDICAMQSCAQLVNTIANCARYIATLDLSNCYYAIELTQDTIESGVANIITTEGCFRLKRTLTGLSSVPAFLRYYMSKVFREDNVTKTIDFLTNTSNFFDDVMIYSTQFEPFSLFFTRLCKAIDRISNYGFTINLEKSNLLKDLSVEHIELFGYSIKQQRFEIPFDKYSSILKTISTPPRTVKQLQAIIGTLNFYRIMLPLTGLQALTGLSSHIKKNQLLWDESGDKKLKILYDILKENNCFFQLPEKPCVNLLYLDSSLTGAGAILSYVYLADLHLESSTISNDNVVNNDFLQQLKYKFDIDIVQISPCRDFITTVIQVYRMYNEIGATDKDIWSMILTNSYPDHEFEGAMEGDNEYKRYETFKEIYANIVDMHLSHYTSYQFVLRALSLNLSRYIHIISSDCKSKPYFTVGFAGYKAGVFVYADYNTDMWAICALKKKYDSIDPYSLISTKVMESQKVISTITKLSKRNPEIIRYGGAFIKSYSESFKHADIFNKELYSIFASLSFFKDYIDVNSTFILSDSLAAVHLLKNVKVREKRKSINLFVSILSTFPKLKIIHIPGRLNKSDFLSRIDDFKDLKNPIPLEKIYEGILHKPILSGTLKKKELNVTPVKPRESESYVTPEKVCRIVNADTIFEKTLHGDQFRKICSTKYSELYTNELFQEHGPYLVHIESQKIFLPDELYAPVILFHHLKSNHGGKNYVLQSILEIYYVFKKVGLRNEINSLISSCVRCLTQKPSNVKVKMGTYRYSKTKNLILLDIMELSKLKSTNNFGVNAVLFVANAYSRFTSLYYLKEMTESEICRSLMAYLSNNQMLVTHVYHDNASYFVGHQVQNFFKEFNIIQLDSAPNHSYSKGVIENRIGLMRQALRLFKKPAHKHILTAPYCNQFINNRRIGKTNITPALIQNYTPDLSFHESKVLKDHFSPNEIKNLRSQINTTMSELEQKAKLKLDKLNKGRSWNKCNPGDIVFIRIYSRLKHNAKFSEIPYIVTKAKKYLIYCKDLLSQTIIKRHISHVKKTIKYDKLPLELQTLNDHVNDHYISKLIEQLQRPEKIKSRKLRGRVIAGEDYDSSGSDHVHFEIL